MTDEESVCNVRVWDDADKTDCGLPLPCPKHPHNTCSLCGAVLIGGICPQDLI